MNLKCAKNHLSCELGNGNNMRDSFSGALKLFNPMSWWKRAALPRPPIDPSVPTYVNEVFRESARAVLTKIRSADRAGEAHNPILICVLKNELLTIQTFMQHYRSAGIECFIFIDNGSTDGTFEYLLEQPDVNLYQIHEPFEWRRKQGWINQAINLSGRPNSWFLYADADELMVFDGLGDKTFADLARQMDMKSITRCRGMMVDMYSESLALQATYSSGDSLIERFPYFDPAGYLEAKFDELISRKGGPRKRVFGYADDKFNPELTKYPLFKLSRHELFANPHHVWPYADNFGSKCYIGILHFKFLPGALARIRKAVEDKSYWDSSREYRCYVSAFVDNPRLTLYSENSKRFEGAGSLVKNDMISAIDWFRPAA